MHPDYRATGAGFYASKSIASSAMNVLDSKSTPVGQDNRGTFESIKFTLASRAPKLVSQAPSKTSQTIT